MSQSKVIEIALGELGKTEFPKGSNLNEYGERYGLNGVPWCVIFLWDVFNRAGERMAFYNGGITASCKTLLRCYREQGQTAPITDIQVGDILILNFSGKMRDGELDTEHCALVVEKGKLAGTWYTVEGNTSPGLEGSQDNGGCVANKLRHVKNVVAVCRPNYKPEELQTVPDYVGRWSQRYWEKGIELDIIDKAKDGKYRPKDNATREEVLAMIIRAREAKE